MLLDSWATQATAALAASKKLWHTTFDSTQTSLAAAAAFAECDHQYSTQILSVEPLMIYVNNFLSPTEASYLEELMETHVDGHRTTGNPDASTPFEQSHAVRPLSGTFPRSDPIVSCMGSRAMSFLGFLPSSSDYVDPMFVRYSEAKELKLHFDLPDHPELDDNNRKYVKQASFFVYLDSDCVGGETLFPYLPQANDDADERKFAATRSGKGLAIRPVRGNAVFWVNTHANGTRVDALQHGALPLRAGYKAGINIWSKQFVD